MRLLIAFFCIANFVLAVGIGRQHAASLRPSFLFTDVGHTVGDADCGITCLPQTQEGATCRANDASYPCDFCHVEGDPAGCCLVDGYHPGLCWAAVNTPECALAADQQARQRSEPCQTTITCASECGEVVDELRDPDGNVVYSCSYNTCFGEFSCPAPLPPPVCEMGPWGAWQPCMNYAQQPPVPVDCARKQGTQFRYRTPSDADACWNTIDNPTSQSRDCYKPEIECLVNCVQDAYKVYTSCPKCWNRYAVNGNAPPIAYNASIVRLWGVSPGRMCDCPTRGTGSNINLCTKPVICDKIPFCPRDCVPSAWSPWSTCDKSCSDYQNGVCQTCTGIQGRSRTITTTAEYGGIQCGAMSETRSCNTQQCPIDCLMSVWSTWSACTAQCGGGQQQRTRYSLVSNQYGGLACGNPIEIVPCGTEPCPVSCIVGEWGDWDRSCPACVSDVNGNPGSRTRSRNVNTPPENGGATCPPTSQTVPCPYVYCPVPCSLAPWSTWSTCTATCGGGFQHRSREVAVAARFGGATCVGDMDEQRACGEACCPVDCVWYWSVWKSPDNPGHDCSARCGGGTQVRSVVVVVPNSCGGKQCGTGKDKDAVQACNTVPCAIDCKVSEWDKTVSDCVYDKSKCSSTCGLGWCVRRRTITQYGQFGGAMCPLLEDWIACNPGPCTEPCEYSDWGSWSECPATCNQVGQQRTRSRTNLNPSKAEHCNDLTMSRNCDVNPCPVDCKVGVWGAWSPCPVECGLGATLRGRLTEEPLYGGAPCPYTVEINYCDAGPCPVKCVVSDWSEWSPCPVTCAAPGQSYYRHRNREILLTGTEGCSYPLEETEDFPCASAECPVPCIQTEWSDWSACVGCGLQIQKRHRETTQAPLNGGRLCQVDSDEKFCNGPPCEEPCTFSPWSHWGPCSKSCSPGTRSRTRYLIEYDADASACPTLVHTEPCVEIACCPEDCKFTYTEWTACSPQGYRRRQVTITHNPACGGLPCPVCRVERDDCVPPEDNSCWLEDCPDA